MGRLIPVPPSLTMPDDGSPALGVAGLVLLAGLVVWIAVDLWRNRG